MDFLNKNLIVDVKCLDCGTKSEHKFRIGKYSKFVGGFLEEQPEQTAFCSGCKLDVFIDLKKIYPSSRIVKLYDGFKTFKKEED